MDAVTSVEQSSDQMRQRQRNAVDLRRIGFRDNGDVERRLGKG